MQYLPSKIVRWQFVEIYLFRINEYNFNNFFPIEFHSIAKSKKRLQIFYLLIEYFLIWGHGKWFVNSVEIYPFRINVQLQQFFFHSFSDRISFQAIAKSKKRFQILCLRDTPCENNRFEIFDAMEYFPMYVIENGSSTV